MGKVNKVEACMFCGKLPCECKAKPKSTKKKSTKQLVSQSQEPTAPFPTSISESVARDKFTRDATEEKVVEIDYTTQEALRNLLLSGMLSAADAARCRIALKVRYTTEMDRRKSDWRKRNGLA